MKTLKVLLCGLLLAVPVFANETDDRKTATSLKYVTHELDTRQNKLETGTNQAITYTNAAGSVEQRTVKSDLAGGSTSDTSLPTVGAVTDGLSYKQDEITPINDHIAVTYTGQTGEISTKGIYQASGMYADQSDNLIDAKTFNAALKNGLDNEFVCSDDRSPNGYCWLWEIHNNTSNILPPEYTQLEFIEGTGTQYIDTGVKYRTSEHVKYVADFKVTDFTNAGLWGALDSARTGTIWLNTDQFRISMGATDSSISPIAIPFNTDRHYVMFDAGLTTSNAGISLLFDGVSYNTPYSYSSSYVTTSNNIMLFYSYGTNSYHPAKMRVYKFQIYLDNVLVFNGIPAKQEDIVGMYDTVSNSFKTDVENGNFIAGPSVSNNIYIPQNR